MAQLAAFVSLVEIHREDLVGKHGGGAWVNSFRLGGVARGLSPPLHREHAIVSRSRRACLEGVSGLLRSFGWGSRAPVKAGGSVTPSGPPRQVWVKAT